MVYWKQKSWNYLLHVDVLVYLQQGNVKTIQKFGKNRIYRLRNFSYLSNDCRNFNEVLRKNMSHDNTTSHEKNGLCLLSRKYSLRNLRSDYSAPPSPPYSFKGQKSQRERDSPPISKILFDKIHKWGSNWNTNFLGVIVLIQEIVYQKL